MEGGNTGWSRKPPTGKGIVNSQGALPVEKICVCLRPHALALEVAMGLRRKSEVYIQELGPHDLAPTGSIVVLTAEDDIEMNLKAGEIRFTCPAWAKAAQEMLVVLSKREARMAVDYIQSLVLSATVANPTV